MLVGRQNPEEDFIQELFDRGFYRVLEQIYFHLPLKTFEVLKKVSQTWKKIISKFQSSRARRLEVLNEQKISSAWKDGKPMVQKFPQFPGLQYTRGFQSETISDESHLIVAQPGPKETVIHFWDGAHLKTLKYKKLLADFVMNSNYFVAPVLACPIYRWVSNNTDDDKDNTIIKYNDNDHKHNNRNDNNTTCQKSFLFWKLSGIDVYECYILPWVKHQCDIITINGHFINRVVIQSTGGFATQMWNLKTLTLYCCNPFRLDYFNKKIYPGDREEISVLPVRYFYNDLPISFRRWGQTENLCFSRLSIFSGTLWEFEENPSFRFTDYSKDHFVIQLISKEKKIVKIVNIANGTVENILDFTKKFKHMGKVKVQGRRIAYKARISGKSRNDIFIDDWRTGQNLAKCSQFFGLSNNDLKRNKSFQLLDKKIVVCIGGEVYSASIVTE
jgi:hypothetical protein